MLVPEVLTIIAADEISAGLVVGHLLGGAFEFRSVIEKVEGEKNHGGDDPLEGEYEKEEVLVPVLPSDLPQQGLDLVLLLLNHWLAAIHHILSSGPG